jgi:hypothetical protein
VKTFAPAAFALAALTGLFVAAATPALAATPSTATSAVHQTDGPGGGPGGGGGDCNPFTGHNCQGNGGTAPPVDKHHHG